LYRVLQNLILEERNFLVDERNIEEIGINIFMNIYLIQFSILKKNEVFVYLLIYLNKILLYIGIIYENREEM